MRGLKLVDLSRIKEIPNSWKSPEGTFLMSASSQMLYRSKIEDMILNIHAEEHVKFFLTCFN
jgi:hypothetical protein